MTLRHFCFILVLMHGRCRCNHNIALLITCIHYVGSATAKIVAKGESICRTVGFVETVVAATDANT